MICQADPGRPRPAEGYVIKGHVSGNKTKENISVSSKRVIKMTGQDGNGGGKRFEPN